MIISLLYQQLIAINEKDDDGNTVLHIACSAGHVKIVDALLHAGANCSTKNHFGKAPHDCIKADDPRRQELEELF